MVGGGRPLVREIFGQPAPVGAKSPIFNRYSPVAPQSDRVRAISTIFDLFSLVATQP